jgi:protein O-mannosyl-transferase
MFRSGQSEAAGMNGPGSGCAVPRSDWSARVPSSSPGAAQTARQRRLADLIVMLLIVIVTLTVFHRVPEAAFVKWDDDVNIYNNPHFGGISPSRLHWMFTDFRYSRVYDPLAWLSWAAVHECFGMNPRGYHLLNLLLHTANGLLVYLLLRQLLTRTRKEPANPCRWRAAVAAGAGAMIWAVHPLQVEPVAWATTIGYCQGMFFLLLSMLSYVRAEARGGSSKLYWLSVTAFAASLLTYPVALAYAVVLLIYDYFRLAEKSLPDGWLFDREARRLWLGKLPFVLVSAAILGITLYARHSAGGPWRRPPTLEEFGLLSRVMQVFYGWAYYLWKPLLPFDLSPFYTQLISFRPTESRFLASAAVVILVTACAVLRRRRWPLGLALWCVFLVILAPVAGFFEHPHFTNDRYYYLASIAWAVLISAAVWKCAHPGRQIAVLAAVTFVCGVFGVMSFRQSLVWRDTEALCRHMIGSLHDSPHRITPTERLGDHYIEARNYSGAAESFSQVLAVNPNLHEIRFKLANTLVKQGRLEPAIDEYHRLLSRSPNFRNAHLNLGRAYAALGRRLQAEEHLAAAVRLNPRDADAHLGMGQWLVQERQTAAAIPLLEDARRLDPARVEIHSTLALAYARQGETVRAIDACRDALRLRPELPGVLVEMAWLLSTNADPRLCNTSEAVRCATRASELTGNKHPVVLDALAAAYSEAGRFEDAIRAAERALAVSHSPESKAAIQKRIHLYATRRPYREAGAATNP